MYTIRKPAIFADIKAYFFMPIHLVEAAAITVISVFLSETSKVLFHLWCSLQDRQHWAASKRNWKHRTFHSSSVLLLFSKRNIIRFCCSFLRKNFNISPSLYAWTKRDLNICGFSQVFRSCRSSHSICWMLFFICKAAAIRSSHSEVSG